MSSEWSNSWGRRDLLRLAAGAVAFAGAKASAAHGDFWNKKQPSEWTSTEIEQLLTSSPWSKEVKLHQAFGSSNSTSQSPYPPDNGRTGGQRGGIGGVQMPGGIGIGIPGLGGMGGRGPMGGGGGRGSGRSRPPEVTSVVRWESAEPVLLALKTPLPEACNGLYVLSVGGVPTDYNRDLPEDQRMEAVKLATTLQPRNGNSAKPTIVMRQPSASGVSILFGFEKEPLHLSLDEKEVSFLTRVESQDIKAKFDLEQMKYQGRLAL